MRVVAVCVIAAVLCLFVLASDAGAEEILGWNEDAVGGEHGVSPDHYAGLVRVAGGNAIRTNLDWRVAEPRLGVWDEAWWAKWQELDAAAWGRRGCGSIFVVGFAPGLGARARGRLRKAGRHPAHPRAHRAMRGCHRARAMDLEWAEYVVEVAAPLPAGDARNLERAQ